MLLLPLQHLLVLPSSIWSCEVAGHLFKKGQWEPEWTLLSAPVKNAVWFSPCLQLRLAQNWHAMALLTNKWIRCPFWGILGNDVHVFCAAPKSSSDNRISRELGTRKMLSLLSSNNCCGNCQYIHHGNITQTAHPRTPQRWSSSKKSNKSSKT